MADRSPPFTPSLWLRELVWTLRQTPDTEVEVVGFFCTHGYLADALERAAGQGKPAALLHEVYEEVHALRFAEQDGALRGPDNYYNGVVNSRLAVLRVASRHGLSEEEVRRG